MVFLEYTYNKDMFIIIVVSSKHPEHYECESCKVAFMHIKRLCDHSK